MEIACINWPRQSSFVLIFSICKLFAIREKMENNVTISQKRMNAKNPWAKLSIPFIYSMGEFDDEQLLLSTVHALA